MRKLTALIALLCMLFASMPANAQSSNSVKGIISDTASHQDLSKAVVSILRSKDSMLVSFARTDGKGRFAIGALPSGKFVLLISYPNYADYTDMITVNEGRQTDLGNISMITKAHLLKEVVVKQNIAIRLKGDTTEYKADSFKVQPNASVEELLKQLPGIQVDKNGKITAQGQTVQKVLVDGEEFFGDDPTLVTQNIRADMVDKVQVFDKKSDQATFSGVDDGQKTKTINLKLKDDKKNGYFGKLDLAGGTDGYYNTQMMFNKFRKKEKLSFYGILSTTGKTGLNWQDQRNFGDNSSYIQFDDGTDGGVTDQLESWSGSYEGQGYPKVQTGGAHYNNKWGNDKQSINGNYKILDLTVNGNSQTNTQYILPDTLYYVNQKQVFNNRITRNKVNVAYSVDFDSTSVLNVMADAKFDHRATINNFLIESLGEDKTLVNQGTRTMSTVSDENGFNSSILWRKKLKKKGRTFTLSAKENYSTTTATGFLYAQNNFFKGSSPVTTQVTDQYKVIDGKQLAFDSKLIYTEPLSKAASLSFEYGVTMKNSTSSRSSFNRSASGKYDMLDTTYSNDYRFNILTQKLGANFHFIKKKYSFSVGNATGFTDYTQTDMRTGIAGERDFINWFPTGYLNYSFTSQRGIWFNYNGATVQPNLQQIQPLRTNDDPLNIYIGNPSLRPSFRNNFSLGFRDYKALSESGMYSSASYNIVGNAFATRDFVDSVGRRVSQTINVSGNNNWRVFIEYEHKLFGANLSPNISISGSQMANEINGQHNVTTSYNYTFGAMASKVLEKLYANSISANATYTTGRSSIQPNSTVHYWTYDVRPDLDFYLPWKLQIHTDIDFIFRQKTSVFDTDHNVIFWNAWFGKKLLKGDVMVIKISANDILNQNIGFSRSVSTNYITENTYQTIQRYFMLSVVWNFSKGNKPAGN